MKSQKIIVFDIDGTIAETATYWLPVLKVMVEEIEKKYRVSNECIPIENALKLLGQTDRVLLGKLFPGRSEEDYAEFLRMSNVIWKELIPQYPFQLFEGAIEVMETLRENGWKIFLSSNCDEFYRKEVIRQCKLEAYISGSASAEKYPGLEKYQFTAELLKSFMPYEGYFVGDSDHDMKAGRENGLTTIYAEYGYATIQHPEWADFRIGSIRELPSIVLA